MSAVADVLGLLDPAVGVYARHQITAIVRDHHVDRGVGGSGQLGHPPAQCLDAIAGMRRDEQRPGQRTAQLGQRQIACGVGLVDDDQLLRCFGPPMSA